MPELNPELKTEQSGDFFNSLGYGYCSLLFSLISLFAAPTFLAIAALACGASGLRSFKNAENPSTAAALNIVAILIALFLICTYVSHDFNLH